MSPALFTQCEWAGKQEEGRPNPSPLLAAATAGCRAVVRAMLGPSHISKLGNLTDADFLTVTGLSAGESHYAVALCFTAHRLCHTLQSVHEAETLEILLQEGRQLNPLCLIDATRITGGLSHTIAYELKQRISMGALTGNGLNSALIAACSGGSLEIVLLTLSHGADINCTGYASATRCHGLEYSSRLLTAYCRGEFDNIERIIRGQPSISSHALEVSALHAAAFAGHDHIVQALMSRGATIRRVSDRYTPASMVLFKATSSPLFRSRDVSSLSGEFIQFLLAMIFKRCEVAYCLLRTVTFSLAGSWAVMQVVMDAALRLGDAQILKRVALTMAGNKLSAKSLLQGTLLAIVRSTDCGSHVEQLLKLAIDHGRKPGRYLVQALHAAAAHGRYQCAVALLAHGADVSARDALGRTPLHLVATRGPSRSAEPDDCSPASHLKWLRSRFEPYDRNKTYGLYCQCEQTSISTWIPDLGWEPKVIYPKSLSEQKLHSSWFATEDLDLVKLFVFNNADMHARDNTGRTPLHCAAQSGWREAIFLFLSHGSDLLAETEDGNTPLQYAVAHYRQRGMEQEVQQINFFQWLRYKKDRVRIVLGLAAATSQAMARKT